MKPASWVKRPPLRPGAWDNQHVCLSIDLDVDVNFYTSTPPLLAA
jgi:hypothetical protein